MYFFKFNYTVITIVLLLTISTNSISAKFVKQILSEKIIEADLIIKGSLIEKYSKMEDITDYGYRIEDGKKIFMELRPIPYTTFIFSIEEILKGDYKEDSIEVKMPGGCVNGKNCRIMSVNYDFKEGEKAVLFLKFDIKDKIYLSTQVSSTVFNLSKDGNLTSKAQHSAAKQTNFIIPGKNGKMRFLKKLNLTFLKNEIHNVKDGESNEN